MHRTSFALRASFCAHASLFFSALVCNAPGLYGPALYKEHLEHHDLPGL